MSGMGSKGQMYASLVAKQLYEDNASLRMAAMISLSKMGERGASFVDEVAGSLDDADSKVRVAAIEAFQNMGAEASGPYRAALENAMNDPIEVVGKSAEAALKMLDDAPLSIGE